MIDAERIAEMKRLSAEVSGYRWLVEGGKFGEHTIVAQAHYADDLQISDAVTDEVHTLVDAQFIAESRQFVPDIIAAYEESKKHSAFWYEQFVNMTDAHAEQAEEIAKLRKALEYYADDIHYDPYFFDDKTCDVTEDEGYIAREALK